MLVNELLNEIKKHESLREWSSPVRLSNTGKCPQALQYQLLGFPKEPLDPRVIMLFRVGDHTEAEIKILAEKHLEGKHWCKFYFGDKIEVHDDEEPRIIYKQIPVSLNIPGYRKPAEEQDQDIVVFGHLDGIGWKTWNDPYLIEIKSMSDFAYDRFTKGTYDESYQWQLQAYMQATGLKKAIVIAMKKQTSHLAEMIIERDENFDAVARWKLLLNRDPNVAAPQYLEFTNYKTKAGIKLGFPCSYCDYKKYCFDGLNVEFDNRGKPKHTAHAPRSQEEIISIQKNHVEKLENEKQQTQSDEIDVMENNPLDPLGGLDILENTTNVVNDIRGGK